MNVGRCTIAWPPVKNLMDRRRPSGRAGRDRRLLRLEQRHVGVPLDEADVWHRMDEAPRLARHASGDRVGPELLRVLELLEDFQRAGDVDAAIGLAGGRVAV